MTAKKGIEAMFMDPEAGQIPCDWNVRNLGSLVDRERSIRYGIVQPGKFDPRGRLLIRGQDYSRGWVDASEMFRVGDEVERRYQNARVVTNDLIITIVGASTGEVAKVPDWLQGANLTQTTARVAVDPQQADTDFVYHVLRSQFGASNVANYLKGGAQPGLNCGDVEKFLLPIPDKRSEQQAIAEALSDADGLIEGVERLIAKKRLIKQGAMQDLLTAKRRLPGFSGEWRTASFTSAFRRINAKDKQVLASDYAGNGDIPVVDQGKQQIAGYTNRRDKCFSPPDDGVIVFGDHTRIVKFVEFEFAIGADGTQLIGSKEGFDARFLAYALGEKDIPNTGYNRHFKFLKEMSFNVPPEKEEQEAIARALSDMDAEIQALETRLVKARQVKEGMMQNLLTGRIRLV
ncbi:restriction endonuclease subunit S [Aliiroseovarius crassostreae]|uniref:restriction endonuclease subunit S n=1 Tax=Aliiroseovarius crassostreae TaxID=154981 RepID=UPI0021AE7A5F|nr:restriction endonuclease subunit S [Aliiroseovarius crassostreae]UWP97803.1 restriction endonuclease subunit S [Aliiroseovarius crassostreae]